MITSEIAGDGPATASDDRPAHWWSFTKTAIAATALRLVDQGKLALDDPIAGKPYTLRHLLQHRAGVPNYGGLAEYHAAVGRGDPPWAPEELCRRVNAETLDFPAGQGWHYSNVGYLFVRRMIEDAVGADLDTALHQLLLDPLDVDARVARTPADLDTTAWGNAAGYHPDWVYHGLLIGSPAAAVTLLHRLLTGDLLSAGQRREMTTTYKLDADVPNRPWRTHGYGLGLMIGDVAIEQDVTVAQGHSGNGPGSVCAVYHFPQLSPPRTLGAFAPHEAEDDTEWDVARRAAAYI